jgi:hypothetical protein
VTDEKMLERVRKLLAKAEAEGVTPQESEALTGKAAELMARYGIERARLGALHPETDKPADRQFQIANPWAQVKMHLLSQIATPMRCQCVMLNTRSGARLHVFGYESDLDRAEMLWTSVLVQMTRALALASVPPGARSSRAWRRSFLLGYTSAVAGRVRSAEQAAASQAEETGNRDGGVSTALVLADRSMVVRDLADTAYPNTRKTRITFTGSGYSAGHRQGQRADLGATRVNPPSRLAIK